MIESRYAQLATGDNEIRLAGQGVGKSLMRIFYQVWNGSTTAPLPMNTGNFGQQLWRFAGNHTPEIFTNGLAMAHRVEKLFVADLSTSQGFGVWAFASENAFRDAVDEATATELRILSNIANSVTLTSAGLEYVQETLSIGSAV